MSGLQFERGKATAADGTARPAIAALCECGSRQFEIFQLDGQRHFHLQCASCGTSYCSAGGCEQDGGSFQR